MASEFNLMLDRLLDGETLSQGEAYALMMKLAEGEMPDALAGALLAGLRAKGETAEEIRGFATAMRELAIHPEIPDGAPTVDTVGTGGDGSGSVNLSTGTGLLAAAAGARVVKHGNRSVSSRSGSADVLECLGMPLPLLDSDAIACLEATNFTFLFAPAYHPAMKAVVPVRGALGVRTVFNMLGPLTNPAAPPFQLIGAWSQPAAKLMADTLSGMPIERAFVVHGEPGWDEATPAGDFVLYDVRDGEVTETMRTTGLRVASPMISKAVTRNTMRASCWRYSRAETKGRIATRCSWVHRSCSRCWARRRIRKRAWRLRARLSTTGVRGLCLTRCVHISPRQRRE